MSSRLDANDRTSLDKTGGQLPPLTDATAEIGNVSDVAEAERLDEDRVRREAEHRPDRPDRDFDRITPQV